MSPAQRPETRFAGATRTSVYVPMRDGTRIALDVYLPTGLREGERVPTVLVQTPYFRSMEFRRPAFERIVRKLSLVGGAEFAEEICRFGYANVVMDLRGSGASFGTKAQIMDDSVPDGAEVLDWIAAQPWSNGNIGATGISGPGMLAQWLTTAKHPALKAIAPRFTTFDIYASTHPGGLLPTRFFADIGALLRAMDSNRLPDMSENVIARFVLRMLVKGLQPVDADADRSQLAAAVREHADNQHPDEQMVHIRYRDETIEGVPGDVTLETSSPFTHASAMEASAVAIYGWAGWLDGGFIREMLMLHTTVRNPGDRIVIGPWGHGGRWYASPVVKRLRTETRFDHMGEMVRFFDLHLRGRDAGIANEPPIHYFTMGEERWHEASEWPLPGTKMAPFHLGANQGLARDASDGPDGSDRAHVDYRMGTGVHSRFGKHLTGGRWGVKYPRRARRDRRLLAYTSAPLERDLEVTGEPVVTLFVSSTAADGAFLVYLEDVDERGTVRVCTDGGLRAAFRATGPAPYPVNVPFHPCRRADEQPLEPGVVTELTFGLFPVSWLFRAGHRIRVAIAGADKDNFAPVRGGAVACDRPLPRHGPSVAASSCPCGRERRRGGRRRHV